MSKFAERLKYLRTEAGLTQVQLAKALDGQITNSAIWLWELGKRVPNLDAAILLAQYFNVTLDYIAGLEDD
ncbi:MAG: helix-turn-helix transcriptional regulator [Clostridia bacterium]|nr:helix-turn-helix transcriptional regulator [Clostridia bacterium]